MSDTHESQKIDILVRNEAENDQVKSDSVHYDLPLQMKPQSDVPAKIIQQEVTLLAQMDTSQLNQSMDDDVQFQDALDHIQTEEAKNSDTGVILNQPDIQNKVESQHHEKEETKIQEQQNDAPQSSSPQKKLLFYVYGGNYPETVSRALIERGNWQEAREEDNIEKCNFLWRPFNYPAEVFKRIEKRIVRNPEIFIYNHFEVLKGLVTKSGLIRSLKQFYFNHEPARSAGYSTFDSTPTTFLMASGVEDAEHTEMVQRYKDFQRGWAPKERIPIKHCVNNIWLVKPANANQGKGIEIFSDLEDLLTFVASRPLYTCCVVQKYIERPLLFKGRKFDIRVWALFTAKHEVFMYKHGYLRTSSDDYSLNNGNNYVHLTNNCLQKYGDKYGVHEEGNTVGFHVLQQYLDEMFPQHRISVADHFIPRMRDLIIDSFLATKNQLNPNRRKHCFELLGYDFLIDEDFRLWMIEINTNPYFGVPNNFIANLLPKMMDDLLDIVVDPIYSPHIKPENCSLPNDFELLYCESNSSFSPNPVNVRRSYSCNLYPAPELSQLVGPKAPKYDLKQLKQFKVQNLQLSTVSFKQKKPPKPKDEVMELFDKSTSNLLAGKLNQRSKSLAGGRQFFQSHSQNQERQTQGLNLRNRNSRSRSSFKQAAQNEGKLSIHKQELGSSKEELSKTLQSITVPSSTQMLNSSVSSQLQTPQNANSALATLKSQPQKQQFTSIKAENQQSFAKSPLQPSLSSQQESIKIQKHIGNLKSNSQQIQNHQYMQPTANSTNRVQSTLNTSQSQASSIQGQGAKSQQLQNIIDVSNQSASQSKTPQLTSSKMIPASTTKGKASINEDLQPLNKRVVDLAHLINKAQTQQEQRGNNDEKNSSQMSSQIQNLFEEIKVDQARHQTERVPSSSQSKQVKEEIKKSQHYTQQPQVYQSKSPFKLISKSPSRVIGSSQVSQSVDFGGLNEGKSQDMFRRNQTQISKNRASAANISTNEVIQESRGIKGSSNKFRDSSLGGRQSNKNARESRINQVLTKDQKVSHDELLKKLYSQGKKQPKELTEKELDEIFQFIMKNLKANKADEWQKKKSFDILKMLFENVMLRTHQIDQMVASILDFLCQECSILGSKVNLGDMLIELLTSISEKLCHKLILSKTQNTLTLLRLYQTSEGERKIGFLKLFKQISIVQQRNVKNEPAIQKILSLINNPEPNGIDMVVAQIHSRAIENGLISLLIAENQIDIESDLKISKEELNNLVSFFRNLPEKRHDLPFSSPQQSYSPDFPQAAQSPEASRKRIDYGQPIHQKLSPRVEMRVNLDDSFANDKLDESIQNDYRIKQAPSSNSHLTNNPMNSADKKFLINLNELANANQMTLHNANSKNKTLEDGYMPSGQRSERVTTSLTENTYIVDLRDKEKYSNVNQKAPDTEKERDTDSCLNSFKDLSTLNGLIGRSPDNGNLIRKEMLAEQRELIEKLCLESDRKQIIANLSEIIQKPEVKEPINSNLIAKQDQSKQNSKQYQGYQSPFKKSVASTPQKNLPNETSLNQLSSITSPKTQPQTDQRQTLLQSKNNQKLGMVNALNTSIQHKQNTMNVSHTSLQNLPNNASTVNMNEYSKGIDKLGSVKYAPVLKNKQIFPISSSLKQSQPFSSQNTKGGFFNQTQDDSYHMQRPQNNKPRERTLERQSASQNQTKASHSRGRVSHLVQSQNALGSKDKAFQSYQQFYQPQSTTPAQTLKQASIKANEIEHNLSMLEKLTGASSPQKLKVTSSKAHMKSSDPFNKSPSLATMTNNFFNEDISSNQERAQFERSLNTFESHQNNGQESLYHSNSEVQPRRDSAPNKIIMSSSHIMGADKNMHYYKRGTQVTQSKKNYQRYNHLGLASGVTGNDTSLGGGSGLNADLMQFDERNQQNQRVSRQQARRSNSRKTSGPNHPSRMLFN